MGNIPIKVRLDSDGKAIGLGEFSEDEAVAIEAGGTGAVTVKGAIANLGLSNVVATATRPYAWTINDEGLMQGYNLRDDSDGLKATVLSGIRLYDGALFDDPETQYEYDDDTTTYVNITLEDGLIEYTGDAGVGDGKIRLGTVTTEDGEVIETTSEQVFIDINLYHPLQILQGDKTVEGSVDNKIEMFRAAEQSIPNYRSTDSDIDVAGKDFIIADTADGEITITLPAEPADYAKVVVYDVADTFATNNCTIDGNGKTIEGDTTLVCDADGMTVELIYVNDNWEVI